MGNKLPTQIINLQSDNDKIDITHTRLMPCEGPTLKPQRGELCIPIPDFKRMQEWQVLLEEDFKVPEQANPNVLISWPCFRQPQNRDLYLGVLLSLKQLSNVSLYNEIELKTETNLHLIITRQSSVDKFGPIQKSMLSGIHINSFLDLLIFISRVTAHTQNMYIPPEEIYQSNGEFFLRSFYYKQFENSKLILTYIAWLYEEFEAFNDLFESEHIISFVQMDIYLREIYLAVKTNKVGSKDLTLYLQRVKDRYNYLNYNFDSFQACSRSKKAKHSSGYSEWLLAKRANEVYFFNIVDKHICQGRVIRKKNKIMVEQSHAIFNAEDLELNFMLEGTKNVVKTSQFELQDCFTISDIEIKYKLPFKMKNPMMFMRGREIYLFDQMVYRYSIDENKLFQESKKVNDCIYLAQSAEHNYFLVRLSTDIFRHGIRVYYKDQYDVIYPSGNPSLASEIEHLKVDIKHVEFCMEVYRGVYLMLANHNFWIVDANFSCFFSYTPIQRLKEYYKNKNNQQEESDFSFQITNQPFQAKWLPHQDNLNVSIDGDSLHVIATVMSKLFYLHYQFILEAGMLRLKEYCPLFNETSKPNQITEILTPETKELSIKVYSEHYDYFKSSKWIYHGPQFLEVYSMRVVATKAHTDIILQTEPLLGSLKEMIESNKQASRKWSKYQLTMLLHTISSIYCEVSRRNITHKNFNIGNLWVNAKKKLKLAGWSEPHRNWYISDYRDYLLTCFNVITLGNWEKITDKAIEKNQAELSEFPVLMQKIVSSLKHKVPEKKVDHDKHMIAIRESLNKALSPIFENYKSSNYLFSFEFNTPRFSMLNIQQSKIKKMVAVVEGGHTHQEFTFKSTDKYAWNQDQHRLYIFTANYQMLEAPINVKDFKEETIVLQEYQYPPQNITECSFIHTRKGLFAFGGISRCSKKNVVFNHDIYHFNQEKLTWVPVSRLPAPLLQPKLVLSPSGLYIYIMGGELDCGQEYLTALKFDTTNHEISRLTDQGYRNPFRSINLNQTHAVFQVAEEESIFLLWMTNSTNFSFQIFSNLVCGLEIELEGKIYLEDGGEMPDVSIAMSEGYIHFLRPYGKYTKISMRGLESVSVAHKTLYSN